MLSNFSVVGGLSGIGFALCTVLTAFIWVSRRLKVHIGLWLIQSARRDHSGTVSICSIVSCLYPILEPKPFVF